MDVSSDNVQCTATARTEVPSSGVIESQEEQSDNEGQEQHLRNAPFACNVCKRSYSRVDHLARHHRSHTREKPFPCAICGKTFARADLVKRHAACHLDANTKKRKRKSSLSSRTSVACTACASAKIKCDNEKPCLRCVKKGITCIPVHEEIIGPLTTAELEAGKTGAEIEDQTPPIPPGQPATAELGIQPDQNSRVVVAYAEKILQQTTRQISQPEIYPNFDNFQPQVQLQTHGNSRVALPSNTYVSGMPCADFNSHESFMPDGVHLGDFLADIMMSGSPAQFDLGSAGNSNTDDLMPDVFDFGIEEDFDLNAIDFQLLSQPFVPGSPSHQMTAGDESHCPPSRAEGSGVDPVSVEAFQKSLWQWTPGQADQGHCEQINLLLPHYIGAPSSNISRPCVEGLNRLARDRMLAMVLNTCDREAVPRIVTSFPCAELLDHLMQEYLFFHSQEPDPFIHIPTFQPQAMRPELVASTVFFGAVRSPVPLIQKLGFALQESVRLALPKTFESDNSMTRDLQVLQANILELKLGLWSGNRRKMEIAESHGLPLITMLRRSGRFKRSRQRPSAPLLEDPPDVLDRKWRVWVEAESFKRLVYFVAVYDAQLSMSFHVPPLIKNGEMSLDLPAPIWLWAAETASAWRDEYLAHGFSDSREAAAVIACVHTAHDMLEARDRIDLAFSVNIALSMFWKVIWDARQLQAATKSHGGRAETASLTSGHWQHELSQTLRNFCMIIGEAESFSPPSNLLREYLQLNVYVSFEELSLFAGKEGHREARRVYASLKQWAGSRDARQALWHAGQVVREATTFAPGTLFGSYACALYHAGLTLWAYGLLTNGIRPVHRQSLAPTATSIHQVPRSDGNGTILLDGLESGETQKFVSLNRAAPAITRRGISPGNFNTGEAVFLDDPKAVMATVISVLRDHYQNLNITPTLVENLIHLMQDLGKVVTTKNTTV